MVKCRNLSKPDVLNWITISAFVQSEKIMNRYLKITGVFLSALTLVACGGGSSDSATSTEGTTHFAVNNIGAYDVSSVRIVSEKGDILFDHKFDCAARTECAFNATMDEPGTLLFSNRDNVIVGAFVLTEKPDEVSFVRTSRFMLGLYLFDELRKRYPEPPSVLYSKLETFFANYQSPDGTKDKYQELGMYYQYRMIGTGLDITSFYTELHDKLQTAAVLQPSLYAVNSKSFYSNLVAFFTGVQLISPAYAETENGSCPAGFLFDLAGAASSFIPTSGLSSIFETLVGMGKEACDGNNDSIQNLSVALSNIKAALDKQDMKLDQIIGLIAEKNARDIASKMQKDTNRLDQYTSAYYALVGMNGYKSLKEYFDKHGGIKKTYEKLGPNNVQLLISTEKMNDMITTLKAIGNNNDQITFANGLDAMCKSAGSGYDVVQRRINCNVLIVQQRAIITGTHGNFMVILKDIMETLDAYEAKEGNYVRSVSAIPGGGAYSSRSDYFTKDLKPILLANLQKSKTVFTATPDGYYIAADGLPDELLANLKKINCNLEGWVKDGANSNIITRCRNGSEYIKSKFYYDNLYNPNDVINVMGVVTTRTWGDATAGVAERFVDNLGFYVPDSMPAYTAAGSWVGLDVVSPNQGNALFVKGSSAAAGYSYYTINANNLRNSSSQSQSVVYRYTDPVDEDPLSYVWAVNLRYDLYDYVGHQIKGSMHCMMGGCTTTTSNFRLSFKNGPQHVWFGMVLPKDKTDAYNNLGYEISGQLLAPN